MVKKYIIDNIKYPKATGGTPITTWLPNQLGASLEYCQGLIKTIDGNNLATEHREDFERISQETHDEIEKLFNEVVGLQDEFEGQEVDQFQKRAVDL